MMANRERPHAQGSSTVGAHSLSQYVQQSMCVRSPFPPTSASCALHASTTHPCVFLHMHALQSIQYMRAQRNGLPSIKEGLAHTPQLQLQPRPQQPLRCMLLMLQLGWLARRTTARTKHAFGMCCMPQPHARGR